MAKDDFDTALEALARIEGVSVEELQRSMLRERTARAAGARGERGLARAGSTEVVRQETPTQAQERWYRQEQELPDGVHGPGGQTAGGIFGEGPISTSHYDPPAMDRAEGRVGRLAMTQLGDLLERLTDRLDEDRARPTHVLPARRRRRFLGR